MENSSFYKVFKEMEKEIQKHKWIESEKAGRDVGISYAVIDWTLKHKTNWFLKKKTAS